MGSSLCEAAARAHKLGWRGVFAAARSARAAPMQHRSTRVMDRHSFTVVARAPPRVDAAFVARQIRSATLHVIERARSSTLACGANDAASAISCVAPIAAISRNTAVFCEQQRPPGVARIIRSF
jgi:hypothetical protein